MTFDPSCDRVEDVGGVRSVGSLARFRRRSSRAAAVAAASSAAFLSPAPPPPAPRPPPPRRRRRQLRARPPPPSPPPPRPPPPPRLLDRRRRGPSSDALQGGGFLGVPPSPPPSAFHPPAPCRSPEMFRAAHSGRRRRFCDQAEPRLPPLRRPLPARQEEEARVPRLRPRVRAARGAPSCSALKTAFGPGAGDGCVSGPASSMSSIARTKHPGASSVASGSRQVPEPGVCFFRVSVAVSVFPEERRLIVAPSPRAPPLLGLRRRLQVPAVLPARVPRA